MKLSIVIPAHNEAECISITVHGLSQRLTSESIDHEILIINDNSTDGTEDVLRDLQQNVAGVWYINNPPPNGFGFAVRKGLERFNGDVVAVFMADGSDTPEDVVRFFDIMRTREVDCVFGSRFMRGSVVKDYPTLKLILNRLANLFIQVLFRIRYNDTTNAFKMYRRPVIAGLKPFLSHHFNLTVELPLKAIIRGYRYAVIPNTWINRQTGVSKLKIKEMGSRYLFIVLYCLLEKWLSRGDYRSSQMDTANSRSSVPISPGFSPTESNA